ncbi:MAG: carbohydrate ABC transporter permease [Cellulosilyticaceae bacterium]
MKEEKDFSRISKHSNIVLNVLFIIISIIMIMPIIFVVIISFTSQNAITQYGYSFFPKEFSLEAYKYIFTNSANIFGSFGVSLFVTVAGTILGTMLMTTYAYVISRKSFKYRKLLTNIALIPLLFSGGMVTNYLVMTTFLGLKNSTLSLILPLAMSPFYIFILKTFFEGFIPESILESARVDGATELQTLIKIVIPIAKPGIATISLFLTLGYWNDWFNAMLYIEKPSRIPIQYLLIKMENTSNFLQQMGAQMGASVSNIASNIPADTMKMAIVVIIVLPIAMAYPYFQQYFVQGLTVGAVKE